MRREPEDWAYRPPRPMTRQERFGLAMFCLVWSAFAASGMVLIWSAILCIWSHTKGQP
jgi:hypothetical protein